MGNSRRIFMLASSAAALTAMFARSAGAQERQPLREDEAQAREFHYVSNADKVDPKKFPDFKAGDRCSKCQIYEDGPNDMGACPLFANRLVAAAGWCTSFG